MACGVSWDAVPEQSWLLKLPAYEELFVCFVQAGTALTGKRRAMELQYLTRSNDRS